MAQPVTRETEHRQMLQQMLQDAEEAAAKWKENDRDSDIIHEYMSDILGGHRTYQVPLGTTIEDSMDLQQQECKGAVLQAAWGGPEANFLYDPESDPVWKAEIFTWFGAHRVEMDCSPEVCEFLSAAIGIEG